MQLKLPLVQRLEETAGLTGITQSHSTKAFGSKAACTAHLGRRKAQTLQLGHRMRRPHNTPHDGGGCNGTGSRAAAWPKPAGLRPGARVGTAPKQFLRVKDNGNARGANYQSRAVCGRCPGPPAQQRTWKAPCRRKKARSCCAGTALVQRSGASRGRQGRGRSDSKMRRRGGSDHERWGLDRRRGLARPRTHARPPHVGGTELC